MNRIILFIMIFFLSNSCKKENDPALDRYFVSEIVNFDLNCSTCILKFPYDLVTVKQEIGASRDNFYQTFNLAKDTFKIGQRILVKIRMAKSDEFRACITLYPSYDYKMIFISDFKPDK